MTKRILVAMSLVLLLATFPATEADGAAPGSRPAVPASSRAASARTPSAALADIRTVFVIVMENHNWSEIKGSPSAPYINNTLLPIAAQAEQYANLPGVHPSLPNYLWLEAGTNFGILDDNPPRINHQDTTQHLTTLLQNAGITWKSYQEDTAGANCPLTNTGLYAPRHNPMVYFDDVTDANSSSSANCIAHVRPYSELATDLTNNTVARYNFITPNLCNDMHNNVGCVTSDQIENGDTWLAANVPAILNSTAYQNNGALFITWDESEGGDFPIGMIALSPLARHGYSSTVAYTHSSTLRTLEEIFGVTPLLGDAATATDLHDLFAVAPPMPTGLHVTGATYNSVSYAWSEADPAASIETSDGAFHTLAPGTTSFTTFGIAYGSYGCLTVAAFSAGGASAYTPYACSQVVPLTPYNPHLTGATTAAVNFGWSNYDSLSYIAAFDGTVTHALGQNAMGYTAPTAAGYFACIAVAAYNGSFTSPYSPYACGLAMPAQPSAVHTTGHTPTSVSFAWTNHDPYSGIALTNDGVHLLNEGVNATSYTQSGLSAGQYACISIAAYNSSGATAYTTYVCGQAG